MFQDYVGEIFTPNIDISGHNQGDVNVMRLHSGGGHSSFENLSGREVTTEQYLPDKINDHLLVENDNSSIDLWSSIDNEDDEFNKNGLPHPPWDENQVFDSVNNCPGAVRM